MAKTIKAIIPLVGISKGERKPSFETSGYQGESCRTATEAFERAVGSQDSEEVKAEMYEQEQRHEHLTGG